MDQSSIKRELREIQILPGNDYCADCNARKPGWASINLGIFLCLNCAGVHRDLGVHLTQVRSVLLDTWKIEWVKTMKSIGNLKSNIVYEATLDKSLKPAPEDSQAMGKKIRSFIRAKYDKKVYAEASDVETANKQIIETTPNSVRSATGVEQDDLLGFGDIPNKAPKEGRAPSQTKEDSLLIEAEETLESSQHDKLSDTIDKTMSYEDKASKIMELFN